MLKNIDPSWKIILGNALDALPEDYVLFLENSKDYFPPKEMFLQAFSNLPKESVRYILFGQDPYPRQKSATGYAFIDGAVENIFSSTGLSREVNRATSLRNFIKMLLVSDGKLKCDNLTQDAIISVDKSNYITTMMQLRENFEREGVLLLNTALIFTEKTESKKHIKIWKAFLESMLMQLKDISPTLILFGTHAKELQRLNGVDRFKMILLEHPYNHTFVCNNEALDLFGKMKLLNRRF